MYDISGYTPEEMAQMSSTDRYYDPADRDRFIELAGKGGIVKNFEARFVRKDQSLQWLSMTGIPYKTELGDSFISIMEDVTDRKLAEQEIRESEEKYRRIIETASEGIDISEPGGRITFANRQFIDMLGYTRDEILGHNAMDFLEKGTGSAFNLNAGRTGNGQKCAT